MTTRTWVKIALAILALCVVALVVAVRTGVLLSLMATPSDWTPKPMADLEVECGEAQEPVPWTYCVHRTPGSSSRDLLVHFHGRRGTARWWNDTTYYPAELYAHWNDSDQAPPTVVSISLGPLWVLTHDTAAAFDEVFAAAHDHAAAWAGHDFDRTRLVGESMGGYNALLAGLDGNARFDRVAALCPPLSAGSPFSLAALNRLQESGAREAFMLLVFSRAFFDDEDDWHHHDPLARILSGENFEPRLHISCGLHDPWGCAPGVRAMAEALEAQGNDPDVYLLSDGHCAIDTQALASFLVE